MNINLGADMNINELNVHAPGGIFTLNQSAPTQNMPKLELTLTGISLEFRDDNLSACHMIQIWHVINNQHSLSHIFEQWAQGSRGQAQWNVTLREPIDRVLWLTLSRKQVPTGERVIGGFYISLSNIIITCLNNSVEKALVFSSPMNSIKNSLHRILGQVVPGSSLAAILAETEQLVNLLIQMEPSQTVPNLVEQAQKSVQLDKLYAKSISKLLLFLNSLSTTVVEVQDMRLQPEVIKNGIFRISSTVEETLLMFLQNSDSIIPDHSPSVDVMLSRASDIKTDLDIALGLAKDRVFKNLEKLKPVEVSPGTICLENTRVVVLNELLVWAQSGPNTEAIFWLYGLAGTGKSTIAATFVQWLQSHRMLGAFFTCKRGHKALSSPLHMLQTICYGLSHVHKPYGRLVAQAIEDDPYFGSGTATVSTFFQQFFEIPFRSSSSIFENQVLFIVIDALDECGTVNERLELVQCLTRLKTPSSWLKVLITRRANDEFQRALLVCSKLYPILPSNSHKDIETFVRFKCSDFGFKDSDIQGLVKAAAGLFIWADTACNYLANRFDKENALKAILKLVPTSTSPYVHLYQLYETILCEAIPDNAENNELFHRVLGAILLAVKPLTQDSIMTMIEQSNISRRAIESVVKQLHAVLQCSDDGKITVIHLSFSEYLLEHYCSNRFRIDTKQQHFNLVEHCIQILSTQLKFNICGFESSHILNSQIEDLESRIKTSIQIELQYASVYWVHHYLECYELHEKELDEQLYQLLHGWKALYWMEVIGLLDQVFYVLKEISSAELVIKETKLQRLVKDISQIIDRYKVPIQEATPHLYISVLLFLPEKCALLDAIDMDKRSIADLRHGRLSEWNSDVMVLEGHNGVVCCVALSPTGRHIVSGSGDNTIRIWDASAGQPVMNPLKGHSQSVNSVAYSPNGRHIVSGSCDATIRIWDATTGQPVMDPLQGHSDSVNSVVYSPDSRHIISGSDDKTIRIWNANTGQPVMDPLKGHSNTVKSVAYSPDGRHIVSGSRDRTIRIWNASTGHPVMDPLQGHSDSVNSVAYSPDGRHIVSGSSNSTTRIWNATCTGQPVRDLLKGHSVFSVAYSANGRHIVGTEMWSCALIIWDAITGQQILHPFKGHKGQVTSAVYSPDGKHVISGSYDTTVRIWNTTAWQPDKDPLKGHTYAINSVAYSPDGRQVVSGSVDNTVRVWDAITGQPILNPIYAYDDPITSVAYSPNGMYIVSGSYKRVWIWNAATGQPVMERNHMTGHSIAYSPDTYFGSYTGVVSGDLFGIEQNSLRPVLRKFGSSNSVAYSPDGLHIVSGFDNTITIWNATTGQPVIDPIKGHSNTVEYIVYSSDGRHIVSGSNDYTIMVWDATSGQPVLGPLLGHRHFVTSVAFSPDGQHIVSGSIDKTVRVWNAATGQPVMNPLEGHSDFITSVVYSPDGRHIVSGAEDATIRIWDAGTGQPVMNPLKGHLSAVNSVAYSPDGRHIVSGSADLSVRIWDSPLKAVGTLIPLLLLMHTTSLQASTFYLMDMHWTHPHNIPPAFLVLATSMLAVLIFCLCL
ncbi:WD40 repeat-like protein [Pluteus cervinus]|uniref:WD40 repeat-like protein n=1 Tax=Pluteus cervinus TaxID=181527 RepID=A0ACD3B7Y4_9AGAR|nr:WD40 repeat-like protein [Pluteus cervinus]